MRTHSIALAALALAGSAAFLWLAKRELLGKTAARAPTNADSTPGVRVRVPASAAEPDVQSAAGDESSEPSAVAQLAQGIHGRVVHGGVGVGGAWVRLFTPAQGARAELVDALPSRVHFPACSHAKCAADGTFVLPLQTAGVYLVSAGAPDLCWTTLGPMNFVAQESAEELELVLPDPGSIEGQILVADDDRPREWIVAASQGDGIVTAVHADRRGHFRFAAAT